MAEGHIQAGAGGELPARKSVACLLSFASIKREMIHKKPHVRSESKKKQTEFSPLVRCRFQRKKTSFI